MANKTIGGTLDVGVQCLDEVNAQTEYRIRRQNPGISEGDMRAEFIRQMYKDDLAPAYLEDVIQWVKEKYKQKEEQLKVK